MTQTPVAPPLGELARAAADLESATAAEIVAWAHERHGNGLVVTASFEDAVLVDVAVKAAPSVSVVLLDTGYLFAETLWYAEELRRRYDLNLTVVHPAPSVTLDNRWQHDVEGCCDVRKVEPLARSLAGRSAWVTGIRRADGPTRANAPIVSWDVNRSLVKVNPLATWSDEEFETYQVLHDLPRNPLTERGYASIGCWPCTRPTQPGEDRRAGRWAGQEKTECGLHL